MKSIKIIATLLIAVSLNNQVSAANEIDKEKKSAESVFAFANEMETFDSDILKAEIMDLSVSEKVKLVKMSIEDAKQAQLAGGDKPSAGLYVLAVLLPPLAVAIHTNWGMPTLYNVLWSCLGYVPGVVHAIIVLKR